MQRNCCIKAKIAFRTLFTVIMHSSERWAVLSCASNHSTTAPIITENNVDWSIIAELFVCRLLRIRRGIYKGHYGICRKWLVAEEAETCYSSPEHTLSIRGSRWLMAGFCSRPLQTHSTQHRW